MIFQREIQTLIGHGKERKVKKKQTKKRTTTTNKETKVTYLYHLHAFRKQRKYPNTYGPINVRCNCQHYNFRRTNKQEIIYNTLTIPLPYTYHYYESIVSFYTYIQGR